MLVVFSFQKTTISFPHDHPCLSNLSFDAHVSRRLSLLNLDLIIPDNKILPSYQRLVGSLTYLAICTRPDIAYAAMALGQFNTSPTRTHLACAKGVLRYLASTTHLSLHFPCPSTQLSTLPPTTQGLFDADWASDEKKMQEYLWILFLLPQFLGILVLSKTMHGFYLVY